MARGRVLFTMLGCFESGVPLFSNDVASEQVLREGSCRGGWSRGGPDTRRWPFSKDVSSEIAGSRPPLFTASRCGFKIGYDNYCIDIYVYIYICVYMAANANRDQHFKIDDR